MTKEISMIKLFENKKIRTYWDEEIEEWYFSIIDVVEVLTESNDPKQYIKKMKSRDKELNSNWGTICALVKMPAADGKNRKTQAADMEGIFRIIQSIPSPKAEPFKLRLAKTHNPQGFKENETITKQGGKIAGDAKRYKTYYCPQLLNLI